MANPALRTSVSLTDEEHRELWIAAQHRHIAGRAMIQTALVQFAFAYLAKYPLTDERRAELEKRYREAFPGARAVQPDAVESNSKGGTE